MIKTIRTRAFVSALLTALLCICIGAAVIVTSASAAAEGDGTVKFSECSAQTGKTASVTVSLENNPGVAILSMTLDYDKTALTLKGAENGELLDTLDTGRNLFWSADGNSTANGVLATLTFDVAEDAEAKDYIISAVINEAYNEDFEPVELAISDGKVTVYDFIYGDANGDWATNGMDVLLLRKYMANYDYETGISTVTVGKGADANGDGTVSAADVLLLRKYMANYNYDTGSSTVVLGPTGTITPETQPAVTTEAPVTQGPVIESKDIVTDYIYHVLSDKDLDFLKTYLTYAYGMTEDDLKLATNASVKARLKVDLVLNPSYANPKYTKADIKSMVELYDRTVIAVLRAETVDEVNQIVANFVNRISAIPTYVDRVVYAYEAIDFTSNYDVIDVVYANALLQTARDEMIGEDVEALRNYGEDGIDIAERVYTEYYRYTGVDHSGMVDWSVIGDEDILYADMYAAAYEVVSAVYELFSVSVAGMELDASKIVYFSDIGEAFGYAESAYDKWYNKYFVKPGDAELLAAYENFRQAFVSEDYILAYFDDYVWEALIAAGERVEQLLAAAEDANLFIKDLKYIAELDMDPASISYFKYHKQIAKVEAIKNALEEWKEKYGFEDDPYGDEDPNVMFIIDPEYYWRYKENSLIIEYFAYLESTVSGIDVDAFIDASYEDLNDIRYNFDFAEYGKAVGKVLDWYFGKEKTVGGAIIRTGGFIDISVSETKKFRDLPPHFNVANLLADGNPNLYIVFDNIFDIDMAGDDRYLFDEMFRSYKTLAAKKKQADAINEDIAELLAMGESLEVIGGFTNLFDGDYENFLQADDDEKSDYISGGAIYAWASAPIVIGDGNFNSMIDWESLDAVYNNYKEALKAALS